MLIDGIDASYLDLDDPTYLDFSYVRRIGDVIDLAWPARQPTARRRISGGAGAALLDTLRATRPRSRQVVFEVDERVITMARDHLSLRSTASLKVRHEDARLGLARIEDASQDLVVGDAFDGTRVPASLGSVGGGAGDRSGAAPGRAVRAQRDRLPAARIRASADRHAVTRSSRRWPPSPTRACMRGRRTGNIVFVAGQGELPLEQLAARARQAPAVERVMDRADCIRFAGGARALTDATGTRRTKAAVQFR